MPDDLDWLHEHLFGGGTEAYARTTDPSPSVEAAEIVSTSKLEALVYRALLGAYPRWLTVVELAEITGLDKWSVSPRMAPLVRKGFAESREELRPNSTGKLRTMTVHQAIRRLG